MRFFDNRFRKDIAVLCGITVALLAAMFFLTGTKYLYGSMVDWVSQHSVLPEVYRQHFYETGHLIPEFLPEVGAGQNAYNFAYYGLLNPIILPSYLLPFVSMVTYLQAVSVLGLLASAWLFLLWLRRAERRSDVLGAAPGENAARLATCLFAAATPLLYHSHKQVMFTAYMPFLLLALIGVDRFFARRRGGLLACMVTLLFLTSYLQAVSAVVVVTVYGIFRWLALPNRPGFVKTALRFAGTICAGVAAGGILLVPTAMAVFSGRGQGNCEPERLVSMLFPNFPVHEALYSGYGLGMTAILLWATTALLLSRRRRGLRFLPGVLFVLCCWPVFRYLLNGFLYSRAKALIPFAPLAALVIGLWYDGEFGRKEVSQGNSGDSAQSGRRYLFLRTRACDIAVFAAVPAISLASAAITGYWKETGLFIADWILIPLILFMAHRRRQAWFAVPTVLLAVCVSFVYSNTDTMTERQFAQELHSEEKSSLLSEVFSEESKKSGGDAFRSNDLSSPKYASNAVYGSRYLTTGLYSSICNQNYLRMLYEDLHLANPAVNDISFSPQNDWTFQTLMGVRFLITRESETGNTLPAGSEIVRSGDGFAVARNNDAYALAFLPKSRMSERQYRALTPAMRRIALLAYAVVDEDLPDVKLPELTTVRTDETFGWPVTPAGLVAVASDAPGTSRGISVPEPLDETLYFVSTRIPAMRFHRSAIAINGTLNALSGSRNTRPNGNYNFLYTLTGTKHDNRLEVTLPHGGGFACEKFTVQSVSLATLRALRGEVAMAEGLHFTKDSELTGRITAEAPGTMVISMPYDEGFRIRVDGREVALKRVDGGLIGCDVDAGEHEFTVAYRAKGRTVGVCVSILGVLGIAWIIVSARLPRKNAGSAATE